MCCCHGFSGSLSHHLSEAVPTYYAACNIQDETGFSNKLTDEPLRFSYGTSYSSFASKYEPRKYTVIQFARAKAANILVGTLGVVCTIIGLVASIFLACKSLFKSNMELKFTFFHLARIFEATLGNLVSLFHNKLGSYLIEDAGFHVTAYHYFSERSPITNPHLLYSKDEKEAQETTLFQLSQRSPEELQQDIERFRLKVSDQFADKLKKARPEILQQVLVQDFGHPWYTKGTETWLLSTDEEFRGLTLKDFKDNCPRNVSLVKLRVEALNVAPPAKLPENYEDVPAIHFQFIPSGMLNFAFAVSGATRDLITETQIRELNIPTTNADTLFTILIIDKNERHERFALLSSEQVLDLIKSQISRSWYLELITKEQVEGLDLAKLNQFDLAGLFPLEEKQEKPGLKAIREDNPESIRILKLLTVNQLEKVLPYISESLFAQLTDQQLQNVDLSVVEGQKREKLATLREAVFNKI